MAVLVGAAVFMLLPANSAIAGPQIWEGGDITFQKPSGADWTLAENQDCITDNVWLTRANLFGIFNIAVEPQFGGGSPADTRWAFVFNNPTETLTASNYQNLVFQPWQSANGSNPPSTVNQPAVVHLISDDIYINIMFTSWEQGMPGLGGAGPGGEFSYIRATQAVPGPGVASMLVMIGMYRSSRRRR